MPSDITFATDQDSVKPRFYPVLNSVALVLKKFNQTTVDVYGHTEFDRRRQHNYNLSQRRALAVANYLSGTRRRSAPLRRHRLRRDRPIADKRRSGRAQNRRVEIQLSPIRQS